MSAKHTPGPWLLTDDIPPAVYAVLPDGGEPCIAATDAGEPWACIENVREAEANARMISAAPEMYSELVRLAEHFGWDESHPAVMAIAKAKGE